jgi:hypothetical protein
MARQDEHPELKEAEEMLNYGQKEGAREGLIGKILFIAMGVGFLVLIILKLMNKI